MSIFRALIIAASIITVISCEPEESDDAFMNEELDKVAETITTANDTTTFELDLDSLFASYGVKGCIYMETDDDDSVWIYNSERIDQEFLPASTFKIVNSLIALDLGLVNREDTIFRWDGEKRRIKTWEADMRLGDAFRTSCLPCFQEVARMIGPERMNAYLAEFDYGRMIVNDQTIDEFWVKGPSRITPREQMGFLQKLVDGRLAVSSDAVGELTEMMRLVEAPEYTVYGKTGWSIEGRKDIGWFVGWYERSNNNAIFVLNIEPLKGRANASFARTRHELTKRVMEITGVIPHDTPTRKED